MTKPTPEEMLAWITNEIPQMWNEIEDRTLLRSMRAYIRATMYDEGKWVLVPREPTDEMIFEGDRWSPCHCKTSYKAMLAAAPKPTKGETP